jgi:hypothetical protein
MEPAWMKDIKSETVCDYFYVIFVAVVVIAVLQFVTMISGFFVIKGSMGMRVLLFLMGLLPLALMVANSLFLYVLCDRSLLAKEEPKKTAMVMA